MWSTFLLLRVRQSDHCGVRAARAERDLRRRRRRAFIPGSIGTQSVQFVIPIPGVNFFRPVVLFRSVIIGQRKDRQTFFVVEVAVAQSREKENETRYHQRETEEDENDNHIHDEPRDTRTAVNVTTARELAGMKMAAATGVTRPAAQQATATTL